MWDRWVDASGLVANHPAPHDHPIWGSTKERSMNFLTTLAMNESVPGSAPEAMIAVGVVVLLAAVAGLFVPRVRKNQALLAPCVIILTTVLTCAFIAGVSVLGYQIKYGG
jgi:hypothetical protein